jgi:hypothetical protein
MTEQAQITFPDTSVAEANRLAGSLASAVSQTHPSVSVNRHKTNVESQDGGATLAIILGSAAISAVAKGIAAWLGHNSGTMIEVLRSDGTSVRVKYASGRDTAETVEAALRGKVKDE